MLPKSYFKYSSNINRIFNIFYSTTYAFIEFITILSNALQKLSANNLILIIKTVDKDYVICTLHQRSIIIISNNNPNIAIIPLLNLLI